MSPAELDAYLHKIKIPYRSLSELSHENKWQYLKDIYFAHITTFPYHNFELRKIARQHPIERQSLGFFSYKKMLSLDTSGGYCFQTAGLLADALNVLGYSVRFCEAYILLGAPVHDPSILKYSPTHVLLVITMADKEYLLDSGLGPQGSRFPILITGKDEPIEQEGDAFKFYKIDDVYVLERWMNNKWLRILQTSLDSVSLEKLQGNLLRLERSPHKIPIRDAKVIVGKVIPGGHVSLFWGEDANQFIFSKLDDSGYIRTILDCDAAFHILGSEFAIHHITREQFGIYCSTIQLAKPQISWTIDFPLDAKELAQMSANLRHLP